VPSSSSLLEIGKIKTRIEKLKIGIERKETKRQLKKEKEFFLIVQER
jgi:hypothetical protein